eukprot:3937933-Rhodomonas_salina.2
MHALLSTGHRIGSANYQHTLRQYRPYAAPRPFVEQTSTCPISMGSGPSCSKLRRKSGKSNTKSNASLCVPGTNLLRSRARVLRRRIGGSGDA